MYIGGPLAAMGALSSRLVRLCLGLALYKDNTFWTENLVGYPKRSSDLTAPLNGWVSNWTCPVNYIQVVCYTHNTHVAQIISGAYASKIATIFCLKKCRVKEIGLSIRSFYLNYLFIEFKENLQYRDMYRHRDMKGSLSGYDILAISHSPTAHYQ